MQSKTTTIIYGQNISSESFFIGKISNISCLYYNQTIMLSKFSKGITNLRYCYSIIRNQIEFTPSFEKAISNRLLQKPKNEFLRLQIFAGQGCEGFTYKFRFDNQLLEDDFVHMIKVRQQEQVSFAVNEEQIKLLTGSTIDFTSDMMKEIFYVKENPNAEISCSCKTSFSPKEFMI